MVVVRNVCVTWAPASSSASWLRPWPWAMQRSECWRPRAWRNGWTRSRLGGVLVKGASRSVRNKNKPDRLTTHNHTKKVGGQEIQHVFDRNLYNGHGVWHKLGDHQSKKPPDHWNPQQDADRKSYWIPRHAFVGYLLVARHLFGSFLHYGLRALRHVKRYG